MGVLPAFWRLAPNDKADEIDIIEAVNTENMIYYTCHWHPNGEYTHESGATRTFDITQFHAYSVLWNENVLQFAADGNEHFTLNLKDSARQPNSFHIISISFLMLLLEEIGLHLILMIANFLLKCKLIILEYIKIKNN